VFAHNNPHISNLKVVIHQFVGEPGRKHEDNSKDWKGICAEIVNRERGDVEGIIRIQTLEIVSARCLTLK
jgi:hypothetical protein